MAAGILSNSFNPAKKQARLLLFPTKAMGVLGTTFVSEFLRSSKDDIILMPAAGEMGEMGKMGEMGDGVLSSARRSSKLSTETAVLDRLDSLLERGVGERAMDREVLCCLVLARRRDHLLSEGVGDGCVPNDVLFPPPVVDD